MDELKLIFASNLIRLRTAAGMTQAELGEQLNYSDKSISKWERGEAIPDAAVLKRMSEIFGVTVDYLLNEHDAWQPGPEPAACDRSHHAIILVALMGIVTLAVLAVISGVVVYAASMVNRVEENIRPEEDAPSIIEEIQTLEEYKGDVVNILVCGIDYEEGRNYSNDPTSNDGMTDMILYCQFDIKGGALRMLQIPRNTLVTTQNRKLTLSNGKTYAVSNYQINSVALSNGGSIAALADVIYDQYHLPIDYYVTIDMQALVEMVDNFGGIEVYIPRDMSYGGSKLLKGYRNLDGASAEFFVRCRHGDGYANSDIDRLNMQRYFYAGLFKRARAMGVTDILNQLPLVFKNYIKTDMDISTIAKLVVSFLKLDSSNIILAQTPVFMGVPNVGKTDTFAGYSCVVPDAGSIANLLNQYFCTYTGPVEVSELHMVTDQWPHGSASTDANVQYMGRIDKESDDAILSGETDLEGAVTTDGQAAGSAN